MTTRDLAAIADRDFPPVEKVTATMQRAAFRQARYMRGCVRLVLGRLPTTDDLEQRRQRALSLHIGTERSE
jgi:hypothetical protein